MEEIFISLIFFIVCVIIADIVKNDVVTAFIYPISISYIFYNVSKITSSEFFSQVFLILSVLSLISILAVILIIYINKMSKVAK